MLIANIVPYVGNAGGRGTGWWHAGMSAIMARMDKDVEKLVGHWSPQGVYASRTSGAQIVGHDAMREEFTRVRLTPIAGGGAVAPQPEQLPWGEERVIEHQESGAETIVILRGVAPEEIATDAAALGCQADVMPLSLEDQYRLVVAPSGARNGSASLCKC